MEDFESSSLPESSGWTEAVKEKSEKQRETYKKAQSQLQKSQKDEKKAKADSDDLFAILLRFIQNPYYENLIPTVTELLQLGVPPRFIIGLTALVYPESALYVLTKIGKKEGIESLLSIHRYPEQIEFDEKNLHPSIRNWMSYWVQFSGIYLIKPDASEILGKKLSDILEKNETRLVIESGIHQFLQFFFTSRNIVISSKVTDSYAQFIIREYRKTLEQFLQNSDADLTGNHEMNQIHLFGLG